MKVLFKTLGCRLNEAEVEQWSHDFLTHGYQITRNIDDAGLIILNSCAVTGEASRKSRHAINRLHKQNPSAKLVVTGCHADLHTTDVAASLNVDLVVKNRDKNHLFRQAQQQLNLPEFIDTDTAILDNPLYSRGRHRAFIKVQDGCRHRCTFCIVTVARGAEQSRQIKEIVQDINRYHALGFQEAVLTGVHLGGYGSEINENLSTLLEAILVDTDIPRIRMGSLEPWDIPENFFTLLQNPRLMPHLHLPLQSGCDQTLKRMARRCKTDEFEQMVALARNSKPGINITTDIIVGFPGETESEWQQSYAFIKKIQFGHIHSFSYSARAGTTAASFPNQVTNVVKKMRSKQLIQLATEMKVSALQTMVGKQSPVLWERKKSDDNGQAYLLGYTDNYFRVKTLSAQAHILENNVTTTRFTQIDTEDRVLLGEPDIQNIADNNVKQHSHIPIISL